MGNSKYEFPMLMEWEITRFSNGTIVPQYVVENSDISYSNVLF